MTTKLRAFPHTCRYFGLDQGFITSNIWSVNFSPILTNKYEKVDSAIVPWKLWHKFWKIFFSKILFFERVITEESFEIFGKYFIFGNEIWILIHYLTDMCWSCPLWYKVCGNLNVDAYANHYGQPIESSRYPLLTIVEVTSCTYLLSPY